MRGPCGLNAPCALTGRGLHPLPSARCSPASSGRPRPQAPPHPTFLPAAARVVAVGDLHGDLNKARRAFRLGGLIDEQDRWVGGTTTAVQARRRRAAG